MRSGRLLLSAAAGCAAVHAAGILTADPIWRYAEVLSIALLLAHALVDGLPALRWVVPAGLAVLLVDAVRTMPAGPGGERYGWTVLSPGPVEIDVWAAFESAFMLCWAPSTLMVILLVVWRRGGWHPRTSVPAAVAAVLVTGYAVVRVVDIGQAVRAQDRQYPSDGAAADRTIAVGLAVLPPLVLGLAALALAAALAGHGRWLAATGAVLLAVVALPHLDASIGAVPLPLSAGDRTALFAWHAITPSRSLPRPVPALTAMVELTAYLLLVAGLTGSRRPIRAVPAEAVG